jgi:cytochrome b subunit of formate dehydrogenase
MVASTFLALWLFLASPAARAMTAANDNAACLACHGTEGMQSDTGNDIYVDAKKFGTGVHGAFTCTTCHSDITGYPHPKTVQKVDCSTCHPDIMRDFAASIHGTARKGGDHEAPTCQSCHGVVHYIVPVTDPSSPVAKKNLPDTCGSCHSNPAFLAKHDIPFAKPVEAYKLSVHGRAVEAGNDKAATCSDCHSAHLILPPRDPRSKINHWNVASTCGACHSDIKNTYLQSVHGQAMLHGSPDAPVCTDCHGEHMILAPNEPQSLVNPARVSTITCGRCHSDERLDARYNLPTNRVPTFEDSYHGLAMRGGSQTVANCASCHGVHNIFPTCDPRSTVNPKNLAQTCGKCHAGAGKRFAIGPVHVTPASSAENPVVRWIRLFYLGVIPLTLGFMLLHNALDFIAKLARGNSHHEAGEKVMRMNVHFRIAHWLVMLSFPILVLTGFALKYPGAWWVAPIIHWEGRFPLRGTIHRAAAVILMGSLLYHLIHLIRSRRDRVILRALLPRISDAREAWGVLRYNLGLTKERQTFSKFNYVEKLEYWAFVWGMAVMTISGLMLWFINFTLRYFPKWMADAATAVHFYEAVLATLAILVWHFYFVIFDPDVYPMDRTWLTGKASADHLRETRPGYYLVLASEEAKTHPSDEPPENAPEAEEPATKPTPIKDTTRKGPKPSPNDEGSN